MMPKSEKNIKNPELPKSPGSNEHHQDSRDPRDPKTLRLTDPAYRYPGSGNLYWKKLQAIKPFAIADNACELAERQFTLDPNRPLHVELGCNGGHVTLEWAKQNPNHQYIGIDWKFKQIFFAAEKAQLRGLTNATFMRAYLERLQFIFSKNEVDFMYLFFPDPWPKKKQKKNRFLTTERLLTIHSLLKKGGIFHIKTDHAEYFDSMLEELKAVIAPPEKPNGATEPSFEILELTKNLHEKNENARGLTIPDVTLFERIFIKQGLPIHSLKLKAL